MPTSNATFQSRLASLNTFTPAAWAALGSEMDAEAATSIAARSFAADPEMRGRLEELEVDAIAVFLKLYGPDSAGLEPRDEHAPMRRRRWGQGAQPAGSPAPDPYDDLAGSYAAPQILGVAVGELLDLPVYDSNHSVVGAVKSVRWSPPRVMSPLASCLPS
jgi:hypothetical protein